MNTEITSMTYEEIRLFFGGSESGGAGAHCV